MLLGLPQPLAQGKSSPDQYNEYEVKAAFIYNLLQYVGWPQEAPQIEELRKQKKPLPAITIGVVGKDPFGKHWQIIRSKTVADRNIEVRHLDTLVQKQVDGKIQWVVNPQLEQCHLLFVADSEEQHLDKIIASVARSDVLTIGDMDGFLEAGGIINFVLQKSKIRIEVNLDAARQADVTIKTQVLKLARRVIQTEKAK